MSTKTVAQRLLVKPGMSVWASRAERVVEGPAEATTALVFADDAETLRAVLGTHRESLAQPATFWVGYPRGNRTDISRDTLWPILTEHGMRPISQVAVDDVWSALRFRALKDGEEPFAPGS